MWNWLRRKLPWLFGLFLLIMPVDICHAKTVTLSWDPSPSDVAGYQLLTSLEPTVQNLLLSLDAGDVLTITVYGLNDDQQHWFCVKAYDAQNNISTCSDIVTSPAIPETVLPELDYEVLCS